MGIIRKIADGEKINNLEEMLNESVFMNLILQLIIILNNESLNNHTKYDYIFEEFYYYFYLKKINFLEHLNLNCFFYLI